MIGDRGVEHQIPQDFAERIAAAFGQDGASWLASLPELLRDIAGQWSLTLGGPFADMAYNYVAPVLRDDGSRAVLKVGVPNPELRTEIEALRRFGGRGSAQLLDVDEARGALLLERLEPGKSILDLGDDEQATAVACQLMRKLHTAPAGNGPFPMLADWARGLDRLRVAFDGSTGPFPRRLVERAESDVRDLLASMNETTLLHGDLHHWNILSARRAPWLAIDPKGIIGEPVYETGAWLRNPFPELLEWSDAAKVIQRRIDQFALDLGFDRRRILAWGIYQALLAGWWSYEEGSEQWREWLAIAALIGRRG